MYYYDVCEPGYWWVTTEIEAVFLLTILALILWIIKLGLGIYYKERQTNEKG